MKQPKTQLAVTLFNLRDHCQNKADLDKTLGRVKEIGYEVVQVSGIGPIPAEEVRELLDKHGLYCCATHESLKDLEENITAVIRKLKTLGSPFAALGWSPDSFSAEGTRRLIPILKNAGERLLAEGLLFGYHNHGNEFEKFTDKTMFQELMEQLPAKLVSSELDVYWAQYGGCDPAALIASLRKRIYVLHCKDYTMIKGEPHMCEVGEGNMNYPAIVKAARTAGVRWFVVEQDKPIPGRDIFESIRISFHNFHKFGVK
jgi:sugar phosphate isomerase/epimerase